MKMTASEVLPKSLKLLLVDTYELAKRYLQALNSLSEKHSLADREGYLYSGAVNELETRAFINGETQLLLQDLGGSKGYDQLRKVSYRQKNCFIVFFENSFDVTTKQWLSELKAHQPTTPILLVRIKSPENDCPPTNPSPANYAKAASCSYLECDLKSEEQVLQVLSKAIRLSLDEPTLQKFNTDTYKIKKLYSSVAFEQSKNELVTALSWSKTNTTFFRQLPKDVLSAVVDLYLKDLPEQAAKRNEEASLKAALADAGFIDPPSIENEKQNEQPGRHCVVM